MAHFYEIFQPVAAFILAGMAIWFLHKGDDNFEQYNAFLEGKE